MTRDELWERMCFRNPRLRDPEPRFTQEGLRKFFQYVYEQGHRAGVDQPKPRYAQPSVFEEIFGGLKRP